MPLLDGDLATVFGAALASLYRDATLVKLTPTDDGSGGFGTTPTSYPVKAMVDAARDRARASSGLPASAVTISVLRAGLPATVDLDDQIKVAAASFRVIEIGSDPAGAAWTAVAVSI